ncbi:MAG: gamma-glutamyltransferase family protein [Pseudomonadota bacterium]
MVVTANPHATRAGADVLRAGGSAVDAAIAIEAVLSLVEPQSSGLAGGGFMVHFDNQTKNMTVYDGRETAPASATPDMFINAEGKRMGFLAAKMSGISTGVPGIVSMLEIAHDDYGRLPWGELFAEAKKLASEGFAVSPRLHGMIVRFGKYLPDSPEKGPTDAYHYFHDDDGAPLPVGHVLKNLDYAAALELIAADPRALYQGRLAEEIVTATRLEPRASGMTLEDLQSFQAQRRSALCSPYRQMQVCGPPPPSSWLAVAMILGILEKAPAFSSAGAEDPANWSLFGEAQRLAYADRDHYVADSDSVMVPVKGLLHQDYLAQRASEISSEAKERVEKGDPWAFVDDLPMSAGVDATVDMAGTTHFVVVDHEGDVVSLTASVESIFGSTRMVGGMFLNNQLTDFSFQAKDAEGRDIANAVAPGKRPRSSMSPTIVLDKEGEFLMATGSPGGNSIIAYTAKSLVGVMDWGLTPQEAVALPNLVARGDKVRIERDRASPELIEGLRDYGFEVKESAGENSGLSMVVRLPGGELEGGVDPRREGVVEIVTP